MNDNLFNKPHQVLENNLMRLWRCDELVMIGEYQHSTSPKEPEFGYISKPYINDRNIYYPTNDHKRFVSIRVPKSDQLIEGKYYRIKAKIGPIELRKQLKNPYLLIWDETKSIEFANDFIPPKEFIELWFHQTGSTPKDAATIASQLKLNSLELYTQTERFIFELIQNADDMPYSDKGVNVELHLLNNFLLFRHNGKFFDRDDVRAIADAAQSNKSENVRQTGYKGIGFKSVFTDSSCVFISSGSYTFKFDKHDSIYNDFNALYSRQIRLLSNSPKDFEQFKFDYSKNKAKYENIDNIPWQIKPIWVNRKDIPEELSKSEFLKHAEVNIALEIGQNVINSKNYAYMIESILSKPKFILFLRNTKRFDYYKLNSNHLEKQQSIELEENDNLINISHNDHHVATFSKIHFDVEINNEEFLKAGFNIEKFEEKEGIFKFKDEFGEIKDIPEKLGMLSITRMTFASQIKDNEVVKLDKSHSILYNYLPTSDQRFGFPFLVNADFITNTSREFILKENKWNQYLMYHIGQNCVRCLTSLCHVQEIIDGEIVRKYIKSYLSLLPESLLNEDDEELGVINRSFNRGFLSSVNQIEFIVNRFGEVKNTTEIIIDETQFSNVINLDIFNIISETKKVLPATEISNQDLNKEYLYIEKYTTDKLTIHLQDKDKQNSLAKALSVLDSDSYKKFLRWLDQYYYSNNLKEDWLFQLPIIRQGDLIVSLTDALMQKDFIFKSAKTFEIEDILQKIGFILSEFSLDDESFKYIKQILISKDSHLQTDIKLYNHIVNDRDLSALNPDEKNRLLNFFKSLYQIGPSDYAANLKLFQSQTRKARALNNMISNKEMEKLPKWLFDFVILESEEQEISSEFQKELLLEKDLLEKIFCNEDLYNEIITNINSENLEEFYSYILKLNKDKPGENKIDFSAIPLVFIEASSKFVLSSKVFWPESLTKLASAKYASVKSVLENISQEQLPHFSALQIKDPFELGSKDLKLNEIKPNQNSFDAVTVNNFLDWIENDGIYNSFFEEYTFVQSIENNWSFIPVVNTQIYDGSESSLEEYFNSTPRLQSKFTKLDESLCRDTRYKIGLLQGDKLLKAIIETKLFDQVLAIHLPQNMTWKLLDNFILNLSALKLETDKVYSINSPEHIILYNIIKSIDDISVIPEDIQNSIDCLRSKIIINNQSISNFDLSDMVQFGKGEERKILKLSDILSEFKGESDILDNLIESFTGIKEKAKLRKLIFKTRLMNPEEISQKIEAESSTYYSVHQVVFQLLYEKQFGKKQWLKIHFDQYWKDLNNNEQVQIEYKLFLDIISDLEITELTDFEFLDLQLKNCVDKNWAIKSEILPEWLEDWCSLDLDKRLAFLAKLGYNEINSPIVKLRQAIITDNYDINTVIRYFEEVKPNAQIIWNTIEWLTRYSSQKITNNITIIKEINNYIKLNTSNLTEVTIPLIESISNDGVRKYKLESVKVGAKIYIIGCDEEFSHLIFSALSKENNQMTFIDNNCGNLISHFEIEEIKLKDYVDINLLTCESSLWDKKFYKKWKFNKDYPIFIYPADEIPYFKAFNNIPIYKYTNDWKVEIEGSFYISHLFKSDPLDHLPQTFPPDKLIDLKEWERKTLKAPELIEENPLEENYNEIFDRMIQNRYGISEDAQNDENSNAKRQALYFLNSKGYEVNDGHSMENQSALFNIKGVDNNNLNFIVRSAKSGLLFINKAHWEMLKTEETQLIAIYPDNIIKIFKNRIELLEDELQDKVLFRITNHRKEEEIDSVFEALESDSHIILVTSEKMKENLFSKLKKKSNELENDVAVADDNFKL